jgi:hypothetical protein
MSSKQISQRLSFSIVSSVFSRGAVERVTVTDFGLQSVVDGVVGPRSISEACEGLDATVAFA